VLLVHVISSGSFENPFKKKISAAFCALQGRCVQDNA
jgi:hypothetical protein